ASSYEPSSRAVSRIRGHASGRAASKRAVRRAVGPPADAPRARLDVASAITDRLGRRRAAADERGRGRCNAVDPGGDAAEGRAGRRAVLRGMRESRSRTFSGGWGVERAAASERGDDMLTIREAQLNRFRHQLSTRYERAIH